MKIAKIFLLGLGLASASLFQGCVGDLDLEPNDPNSVNVISAETLPNILAKCYAGVCVEGQSGNGDGDISGIDTGKSNYIRGLFMMNEFPTDEAKWIWKSSGIVDLCTLTFGSSNANIYGTYCRFYSHIAVCNDFIRNARIYGGNVAETPHMILEARTLRALSYYWIIDIFGLGSFTTDEDAAGSDPVQLSRSELCEWFETEITDIIATWKNDFGGEQVEYGKVGLDAAQALAARYYLNRKVYCGKEGWTEAQTHAEEIIARHQGGGFEGSGLAKHWHYLFCRTNSVYAPGGGNKEENEILWDIPYDSELTKSNGGTLLMMAGGMGAGNGFKEGMEAGMENGYNMDPLDYGTSTSWTCMHATEQFSDKFAEGDLRQSMWLKEANGFAKHNKNFTLFNNGYAVIKFTGLIAGTNGEWSPLNGGKYDPSGNTPQNVLIWSSTDFPMFRLAEMYLIYTEANILGGTGDANKALKYVNYVRNRAGQPSWNLTNLSAANILDERCRELYWELTRRSDLVRHGKFSGNSYIWNWKGDVADGVGVDAHFDVMPVPTNIIAAQPYFKQNPGY